MYGDPAVMSQTIDRLKKELEDARRPRKAISGFTWVLARDNYIPELVQIVEAALVVDQICFTHDPVGFRTHNDIPMGMAIRKEKAVRKLHKLLLKKYPHLKGKRPAH